MDQDFGHLPPSFPLPLSTLSPHSSFSQPPPQFTLAGRPKQNYRLSAQYIDVNPEPLRPFEEELEDEQPTAALPCLRLIVRNLLRTATNSFGLLREYIYWLPLILTPLFPKWTFTELEEQILYLFCHNLHPLFIEMNQLKCL